jgi:phosphate transport system substrate-binding protein
VLSALASSYNAKQSATEVVIPPSVGSGGGIAAIGSGAESLARIARPLKDNEIEKGLKAVPIAKLPSAIYVNRSVGVDGITSQQLTGIYAGLIRNWSEVGGGDLPVKVVRREDADSTLMVLRATMPGWDNLRITERSKIAMTTQEAIDSVQLVEGAIGFGPFTKDLESRVTVLKIDGMYPDAEAYPSAVILAAAYKDAPSAEAQGFLDYLKTADAHGIISRFGAVPLANGN